MSSMSDIFGPVIHSYSRAQGIEDGVLVDVSEVAREAGFKWPVAMTRAAWEDTVAWTDADNDRKGGALQDEAGRLWDAVFMAFMAIKRANGGTRLDYTFLRVPREGRSVKAKMVTLTLVAGPGDNAEPVITLMLPSED